MARLCWQEEARLQWVKHFVSQGQLAEARALGWQLTPPTEGGEDVEGDAATMLQRVHRGKMTRRVFEFMKLELARVQWVDYYIEKGMLEQARELGWEGESSADGSQFEGET